MLRSRTDDGAARRCFGRRVRGVWEARSVATPTAKSGEVRDLAALLDLEELDRDLFRGRNADHGEPRFSLYGGQVAAQALRAASLTVDAGRRAHSLHGYFLRPGQPDHPVIFSVDRDRDGGSFSARHVRAVQHGEVIFSMLASFKVPEEAKAIEFSNPKTVPLPDEVASSGWDALVETRPITGRSIHGHEVTDSVWCRVATPMPEDLVVHACALVYMSDYGGGFVMQDVPGLPLGGPSIDHVLWFHQPVRVDEWVHVDLQPERASDARGTYGGTIRALDGTLAAVLGQECLLRPLSPPGAGDHGEVKFGRPANKGTAPPAGPSSVGGSAAR